LRTVPKRSLSGYCSAPDGWPLNYVTALCEFRRKRDQASYLIRLIFVNFSDFQILHIQLCGPGSVVGIATAYGLDGPGIESRWGEIFRTSPDRPRGPPSLLYNGYRVFPGGKVLPGRDADPSPLLVQRSKIE